MLDLFRYESFLSVFALSCYNEQEIDDNPPNPNQPISKPLLAPKRKVWTSKILTFLYYLHKTTRLYKKNVVIDVT